MARELTATGTALVEALSTLGITTDTHPNLFKAGFEINSLPAKGVFEVNPDTAVSGELTEKGDFRHIRIGVKDSELHSISTSALKANGIPATATPSFREGDKGWYLVGNSLNPQLSKFSHIELADFLHGKAFKAQKVSYKQLPYLEGGYQTEPTVGDLKSRDLYIITLL